MPLLSPSVEPSVSGALASWSTLSEHPSFYSPETLAGNSLACVAEQVGNEKDTSQSRHRLRVFLASLIQSDWFEWAAALFIVLNAAMIGIEQSSRLNGHDWTAFAVFEHLFLCVFTLEILARVFAFGVGCFRSPWIVFDFILISVSIVSSWILPLFMDGRETSFGIFTVLRTVRLLRLGRTLRLLIRFKELWMLVRGLLGSFLTIVYTLVLLSVIIYMCASLGIELITNNPHADPSGGDPEFVRIVEENFANLGMTMLTLVQFVTLDSAAAIYVPLIRTEPYLILYFAGIIVILGIVLMNLITAVVVNSALEQATQDKEMVAMEMRKKKARCIRDVSKLFQRMDTDDSGTVTREEFTTFITLMREETNDRTMLQQIVSMEPEEVFGALDVFGRGEVSIGEFCDVLWDASINAGSIELKRAEKKLDALMSMLQECTAAPATLGRKTWKHEGHIKAAATASDSERPLPPGVESMESPPRAQLHEHHEAAVNALGLTTSADTEPWCETFEVLARVSPKASPGPTRATASTTLEPSRQNAEAALPHWATCLMQAVISELQVTRQMLVQEVHHAYQRVYESTAQESRDDLPPEMPPEHHHYVPAVHTKRFSGAPARRPAPPALAARQTERPGCPLEGVASKDPSAWRSCSALTSPTPTTHFDVRQEPNGLPV